MDYLLMDLLHFPHPSPTKTRGHLHIPTGTHSLLTSFHSAHLTTRHPPTHFRDAEFQVII